MNQMTGNGCGFIDGLKRIVRPVAATSSTSCCNHFGGTCSNRGHQLANQKEQPMEAPFDINSDAAPHPRHVGDASRSRHEEAQIQLPNDKGKAVELLRCAG